jgi:hypothetical protein
MNRVLFAIHTAGFGGLSFVYWQLARGAMMAADDPALKDLASWGPAIDVLTLGWSTFTFMALACLLAAIFNWRPK